MDGVLAHGSSPCQVKQLGQGPPHLHADHVTTV
jgi:hypothetical protein